MNTGGEIAACVSSTDDQRNSSGKDLQPGEVFSYLYDGFQSIPNENLCIPRGCIFTGAILG